MKNKIKNQGFTLLIAAMVTGLFVVVSFAVVNIAVKQLILADAGEESQYAFYNADSGTECAIFWDIPRDGSISHFDPYGTANSITCGSAAVSPSTLPVPTINSGYSTSTFTVTLTRGCVVVSVVKKLAVGATATTTKVDSKGYNNCSVTTLRRFERGVTLTY